MSVIDEAFPEGDHFMKEGYSSADVFYLKRDPRNKNTLKIDLHLSNPNLRVSRPLWILIDTSEFLRIV
jgi:hypothetical protein